MAAPAPMDEEKSAVVLPWAAGALLRPERHRAPNTAQGPTCRWRANKRSSQTVPAVRSALRSARRPARSRQLGACHCWCTPPATGLAFGRQQPAHATAWAPWLQKAPEKQPATARACRGQQLSRWGVCGPCFSRNVRKPSGGLMGVLARLHAVFTALGAGGSGGYGHLEF